METYSKLAFLLCYKSLSPAISQKSCKLVFFDAIELALEKYSKISFFISFFLFFYLFLIGSHYFMQGWAATTRHAVKRKKEKKDEKI